MVRKDSRRVETKRKLGGGGGGGRNDINFIYGAEKEHLIVRRFPGNARSSF
jgi:hypothetical protein